MDSRTISGVSLHPLKQIRDSRGAVMHMLRRDDPWFQSFGEIYFSFVHSGIVKGWKRHRQMEQFFTVPVGTIEFAIYDDRPESPTRGALQEIIVGEQNYCLIHIPSMLWYSFKGLSENTAMIANCATLPHDPTEAETRSITDTAFPRKWD